MKSSGFLTCMEFNLVNFKIISYCKKGYIIRESVV